MYAWKEFALWGDIRCILLDVLGSMHEFASATNNREEKEPLTAIKALLYDTDKTLKKLGTFKERIADLYNSKD